MKNIKSDTETPTTPVGLSEKSAELWASVAGRRAKSPERLALLEQALRALDRADEAAAVVVQEGLTRTTTKSGAVHVHPVLRVESESRTLFAKIWQNLGLAWDCELDGGFQM